MLRHFLTSQKLRILGVVKKTKLSDTCINKYLEKIKGRQFKLKIK